MSVLTKSGFPKLIEFDIPRMGEGHFVAMSYDDLLEFSITYFNYLEHYGELYEEEPSKDRYPEISDEYIENAPTDSIKYDLKELRERREQWLDGVSWNNTYEEAKQIWLYYKKAKEDGVKPAAFHYLQVRGIFELKTLHSIEQFEI